MKRRSLRFLLFTVCAAALSSGAHAALYPSPTRTIAPVSDGSGGGILGLSVEQTVQLELAAMLVSLLAALGAATLCGSRALPQRAPR